MFCLFVFVTTEKLLTMGDREDKTGEVNKGEKKSVNKTPETDQIK